MVTWRALALAFLCLPAAAHITPALAAQNDPSSSHASKFSEASDATNAAPASGISIAVADFSGADKELGRFLADTLLTDLAQSERLRMVERAEIGKALTELKLQSTGLAEPQDIKKVGRLLGADRLIVGSYLVRDGQMLINARLLDVRTGRVTSGGAANVTGNRDNVLPLVHQLAHRFHKRVTGAELLLENERVSSRPTLPPLDNAPNEGGEPRPIEPEPRAVEPERGPDYSAERSRRSADGYNVRQPEDSSLSASSAPASPRVSSQPSVSARGGGYSGYSGYNVSVPPLFTVPASVSPLRPVTSGDISRLVGQAGGGNASRFFTSGSASLSVSRLRALVALVRAGGYPVPASAADPRGLAGLIPDANQVPLWAVGPVAVAVRRGLWPIYHALHPADSANWGFVSAVVGRVNVSARLARSSRGSGSGGKVVPVVAAQARGATQMGAAPAVFPIRPLNPDAEAPAPPAADVLYTGLLVEARDFPVQRTMSARIVDTSGRQVYPDTKNVPDIDYVEDHGMADYYHNGADARRAGDHPLVVRAVAISGDAIVISVEAAERILSENRHDGFLRLWRVGILLDEGR